MRSEGAEALQTKAREAGARGDYAEALTLLTEAATLAPDWPFPVYDRAFTRLLMEDFDGALADYEKTLKLAPITSNPKSTADVEAWAKVWVKKKK